MKTITQPKRSAQVLPQRAKIGTSLTVVDQEPEVPEQARNLVEVIARASKDPNTDVDKLERLLNLYERVTAQEAKRAFQDALNEAQAEMRPISADAENPQTKSKYATFGKLDKALRPIYNRHGFGLSFDTGEGAPENYVRVLCYVSHTGGHSHTYHIDMPADGKGAKGGEVMSKTHATGAAVSYGSRYLLKAIFNVAIGEDDQDGNDPLALVTEEQAQTLRDLIARGWPNDPGYVEKFCQYLSKLAKMEVTAIVQLPRKYFEDAVIALNIAERNKAKK